MVKSWFFRLVTLVVLLSLGACGRSSPPDAPQGANGILPVEQSYELTMKYEGLIGIAQDTDKVWVFLPNANYDPNTVQKNDLPPGMYQELGHGGRPAVADLKRDVPPHLARLRFTNAEVKDCARCERVNGKWELPLQGDEVTLNTPRGLGKVTPDKLNKLVAGPELIAISRGKDLKEELLKLDHLDPLLLPPSPVDKQRLAARVAIEAGTVTAIPDLGTCRSVPQYTLKLSGERGCPGNIVSLAEELVVTQDNVKNLVVSVGAMNISVVPSGPKVLIEVLNQTPGRLADPCVREHHLKASRWFYRLFNEDGQKKIDKHYIPCQTVGDAGPPECPNWYYSLPEKVK